MTAYRPESDPYWRMLYPQAYRQLVHKCAEDEGMDENLIWAIMMQESGFRPRIVSPAGARGLMQMIPTTAKSVAKKQGVTDFRLSDLFYPKLNIKFGISYLGDVVRGFGDHPAKVIMAIASYNGGPQNAHQWQRERPAVEIDEWVEEIPFGETKNYVKKVLGNWAVYQMLYGKGSPQGLTIPLGVPMVPKQSPPAAN
jgi:soluble lytic murein transglycosylase